MTNKAKTTLNFVEVMQQLSDILGESAPQQYKAVKYILDHPEDVALKSMRHIARDAGVKPTTISRLSKNLGFNKYAEFRAPFVQRLTKPDTDFVSRLENVQQQGSKNITALFEQIREQDIANIQSSLANDKLLELLASTETLNASERVYILGLRGSYSPAFFFHYAYQLFRNNSFQVETSAGMFADQLRGISANDSMLVISFDPYTKMTIDAVDYAAKAGAKIIAVTDKLSSPIARQATHVLIANNRSPSFYQSLTGALAVTHALITLLVAKTGDDAVKIMESAKQQLSDVSAYW
ncbi:MAG: MurR/RpiR family transcriptional regulator [Gammaproteobacteria bacterium]|nr:MurR/RpiR family transcriptional regulator [Gammaproteobacteria bacterium]